jgi:hypothetical protein
LSAGGSIGARSTCESLHLNLEAAAQGKSWLLLPEACRTPDAAAEYPLPTAPGELQRLIQVPIPPGNKQDAGALYLRRALKAWKSRASRSTSALVDTARRADRIEHAQENLKKTMDNARKQAWAAVASVQEEAKKAAASLNDLFVLGKRGLEGQMRAHLDGRDWQGAPIDAKAFRDCFRLVSQAVKGLGLPAEDRPQAKDAWMEELAASLKSTEEALALQKEPEGDPEKPN